MYTEDIALIFIYWSSPNNNIPKNFQFPILALIHTIKPNINLEKLIIGKIFSR